MKDSILEQLKGILKNVGTEQTEFSAPPKSEMGDLAFPCFGLAKEQGKNPAEVAKELAEKLQQENIEIVEKIQAFGPYVNFFLKTGVLAKEVVETIQQEGENYGVNEQGKGRSVLIEYPSNNTHKEFHIGHLRNVCIGNTLVQLYRKSGYTVVPVNYLNDFGAHVAKCLWGVLRLYDGNIPEGNRQKWLGEVYAEASSAVKENEEYQKEVAEIQKKLEAKDPEIWSLFVQTRDWSIEKFQELFQELKVEHQHVFYESEIKSHGQKIVDELLQKGIAKEGERGAIIIDLEKYNLNVALVRKSDGTGLYLTSDIPLAEEKFKKYDVDESIVITGVEQNFYFEQLHKILELLGFKKKLTHIGYGLVNLPEGKMSSRLGNVILYEDLRDEIFDRLMKETKERHPEWSSEKIEKTVSLLTQAALKFTIQKHEASKNIVFDLKEAVSFDGFSGPYVLYVVARIHSLLKKSPFKPTDKVQWDVLKEKEEKNLLLILAEYPQIVEKALAQYNPSVVTKYCFDLAQAFNGFYNSHTILDEQSLELSEARLLLSDTVEKVLKNALALLTLEIIDEM